MDSKDIQKKLTNLPEKKKQVHNHNWTISQKQNQYGFQII